jgi:VWFA-related protein
MAKPRLHESSAIVLMLLFIIATGVISQERKSVQQRILVRERITSVVVRDADGTFVKGLTPADFRILIDGKSVQVRAVMEHQQVNPDSPELADFALKYREAVKEGHVPPESPAPPRHIIFVFDSYNSGPKSIRSAKESALTLLNEIVIPGDNVLVFELNNGMRHLAGPTSDIAVLAEAIESVTNLSSNPLYKPQIEELRVPSTQSQVMQLKSLYLEKITRFKNYVKLLQGLTHALSVLPGRKTYLIFSEGANIYKPHENTRGVRD